MCFGMPKVQLLKDLKKVQSLSSIRTMLFFNKSSVSSY